jgi:phage-related protein
MASYSYGGLIVRVTADTSGLRSQIASAAVAAGTEASRALARVMSGSGTQIGQQTGREITRGITPAGSSAAKAVSSDLAKGMSATGAQIGASVGSALGSVIGRSANGAALGAQIGAQIGAGLDAVRGLASRVAAAIPEPFRSAARTTASGIASGLSAAWEGVQRGASAAARLIPEPFRSAASTAASAIGSGLGTAWRTVESGARTAGSAMSSALSSAWTGVRSAASTAASWIPQPFRDAAATAGSGIQSALSTAFNWITGAVGKVASAIGTAFGKAAQWVQQHAQAIGQFMSAAVTTGTVALGAFGAASFKAAARVGEMNATLKALASANGLSYDAMQKSVASTRAQGIEAAVAQGTVAQLARNQLDVSKSTDIARIAQDAAVISGQNSTDTLGQLIHGITTQNSLVLRNAGVNVQAGQAMDAYAKSLGKSSQQLTESERAQAVLNAVIQSGSSIAGAYAAAMEEPGKVLRSFPRVFNDIKVSIGAGLVEGFGPLILKLYELAKTFSASLAEGGKLHPLMTAISNAATQLAGPLTTLVEKITNFIKNLDTERIQRWAGIIEQWGPKLAVAAGGVTALAAPGLLGNVPVLGKLMEGLGGPLEAAKGGMLNVGKAALGMIPGLGKLGGETKMVDGVMKQLPGPLGQAAGGLGGMAGPLALAAAGFGLLMAVSPEFRAAVMELVRAVAGALKPALDAIMGAVKAVIPPIVEVVKVLGAGFAVVIKAIVPIIQQLGQILGGVLKVALQAVVPIITMLANILGGVLRQVFTALTPLISQVARMIAGSLGQAMQAIIPPLMQFVQIVVQQMVRLMPLLMPLFTMLVRAVMSLIPPVMQIVPVLIKLVVDVFKALMPLLPVVGQLIQALVPVIITLVQALMPIVTILIELMVAVLKPLMPLITLLAQILGAVLVVAIKILVGYLSWWIGVLTKIVNAISAVVRWLMGGSPGLIPAFQALWDIVSSVVGWMRDLILSAFNAIRDATVAVWGAIGGFFSGIWTGMRNAFNTAVNFIWTWIVRIWTAIQSTTQTVWNAISGLFSGTWTVMRNAFNTAVNFIWGWVTTIWNTIRTLTDTVWRAIGKLFADTWNAMKAAFDAAINFIWSWIVRIWTNIQTATTTTWNAISGFFTTTWETIKTTVGDAAKWVYDRLEAVWGWIRGGADKAWTGIVNSIRDIFDKVRGYVEKPVRWVVDHIINPLIKGISFLMDKVGLGKIDPIQMATGGRVPEAGGQVPGGWGGGDRVHALLEPGEWVLTKRQARGIGYDRLRGLPRYAEGGIVRPETRGFSPLNVIRAVGGVASSAWDKTWGFTRQVTRIDDLFKLGGEVVGYMAGFLRRAAAEAFKLLTKPLRQMAENVAGDKQAFPRQWIGKTLVTLIDKAVEFIEGKVEPEFAGGAGVDDLAQQVMAKFPGLRITSAKRPGDPGYHGKDMARDLAGPVDIMRNAARWMAQTMVSALLEGIFNPDLSVKNGAKVPPSFWGGATWAGHADHIHMAAEGGGPGGGGVPGNVESFRGMVTQAANQHGIPWMVNAFLKQIQTESSGNPRAIQMVHDINWPNNRAQGLLQIIPTTFRSYCGPYCSRGPMDPWASIWTSMNYAISRYGKARLASVIGRGHGYQHGGIVGEPVAGIGLRSGTPYSFAERGPELVSPLQNPGIPRLGAQGQTVINVYPRQGQDEMQIAAAVSRELAWAQAGGAR